MENVGLCSVFVLYKYNIIFNYIIKFQTSMSQLCIIVVLSSILIQVFDWPYKVAIIFVSEVSLLRMSTVTFSILVLISVK